MPPSDDNSCLVFNPLEVENWIDTKIVSSKVEVLKQRYSSIRFLSSRSHTQDFDDFGFNVESLGMAVILTLIDLSVFRLKPPMEISSKVDGNCARW